MMEIFSVHPVTEPGIDALPHPDVPYYALSSEGLFLHRKTQIGTVLIKQTTIPKNAAIQKIGHENGVFTWTGKKIPGNIISQATDFFRRIYDKHKTEAEVIITMHNDTGDYRLFIPYQRVSGAGVKSIYEPTHINKNYTVVGSIHSHCHFSAFHSGTDSADAADMDGIHFTIGMLQNEPPEIVAMVTMGKKEFHYKDPSDVAELVFRGDTAPEWWDDYVFPTTTNADKPKKMRSVTQEEWNRFRGLTPASHAAKVTPTQITPYRGTNMMYTGYGEDWDDYTGIKYPYQITKESQKFNKRHKKMNHDPRQKVVGFNQTAEDKAIDDAIDEALTKNVIVAEDWTTMEASQMDDIGFWRTFFLDKLDTICDILERIDVGVEYKAKEI